MMIHVEWKMIAQNRRLRDDGKPISICELDRYGSIEDSVVAFTSGTGKGRIKQNMDGLQP